MAGENGVPEEVVEDIDVVFDSMGDDDVDFSSDTEIVDDTSEDKPAAEVSEDPADEEDDDDLGVPVSDASAEDDEDSELTAEEEKSYSASVKKRIQREIKLRKAVQADLAATQQRTQQIASVLQRGATNYNALQQQHDTLQEQYYKLLDTSMQAAADQKMQELQAAKEQGNTAAEIQLQNTIEELRFSRRQLADISANFANQKAARAQRSQQAPAAQPQAAPAPALAVAWLAKNKWIQEPKYAPHREYLSVIDEKLVAKGLSRNSPSYYHEVDKELRKAFPPKAGKKKTSPVSGVSSGSRVSGAISTGAKRSITLTRADIAEMRNFGLNPENKQHVLAFAKERMRSQAS